MKPFSLVSNIQRLLKPSESEEFSIINGLKVFCIIQVIPGHRWLIEFGNPQSSPNYTHWVSVTLRSKAFYETFVNIYYYYYVLFLLLVNSQQVDGLLQMYHIFGNIFRD